MNSEELELSLRNEFEDYLNGIFGRMRQDVSDFQKQFETEFEKHRAQLEQAFKEFSARFETVTQFDKAFTESVTEHLRLARDEGAKITETALSEAAKLDGHAAAPVVAAAGYDRLRDAITDIGSKNTQSAILRSLVEHASEFTPRGAFFIVRNDRFVCWKVFGKDLDLDAAVPEVQLDAAEDTILAESVRSLATRDAAFGKFEGDSAFLDALSFGQPDRMYAVPLTARGRGVAVLYADYGTDGVSLNLEAIETLVRVAGLTVELQAASQAARTQLAGSAGEQAVPAEQHRPAEQVEEPKADQVSTTSEYQEYSGPAALEVVQQEPAGDTYDSEAEADKAYGEQSEEDTTEEETPAQDHSFLEPAAETQVESPASVEQPSNEFAFTTNDYEGGNAGGFETIPSAQVEFETAGTNGNGHSYQTIPQAVIEPPVETAPARTRRFSSRNVDLPIEVSEDERKLHNEARRFARLLVSEIKLYNEQQVRDARDAGEIYPRLRDAIDRSREMYDNRVKPEVKSKFDYFHYELVNGLAEGNAAKLGANYPGAAV